MACKRSAVRSRYSPPKKHCTSFEVRCFSFLFRQKNQECTARHAGGPVTPPISIETVIRFNACSVFRAAPTAPCQEPPAYLYVGGLFLGRGWITQAALLKTAHWAVFALSSTTAPQLFESTLAVLCRSSNKTETPASSQRWSSWWSEAT